MLKVFLEVVYAMATKTHNPIPQDRDEFDPKLLLNSSYMKTHLSTLLAEKDSNIFSVSPKTTVKEAARIMTDNHIRSVVVLDQENLLGIFTERDILRRVVMFDLNPSSTMIEAVMTKDLNTGTPSTLVHEALELMGKMKHGHLPILKDGKLIGMISISDITRYISLSFENEACSLWSYISGDHPHAVLDLHEETG
jgi:CBS domain-containing protein